MIILRRKTFGKPSGDTKVYMVGGTKKIKDLSNKQLENIIKFEEPKSQKNVKKNSLKSIAGMTIIPSSMVYAGSRLGGGSRKSSLKRASIMSLIGAGTGTIISQAGYKHHKKEVQAAKEELKKRRDNG